MSWNHHWVISTSLVLFDSPSEYSEGGSWHYLTTIYIQIPDGYHSKCFDHVDSLIEQFERSGRYIEAEVFKIFDELNKHKKFDINENGNSHTTI